MSKKYTDGGYTQYPTVSAGMEQLSQQFHKLNLAQVTPQEFAGFKADAAKPAKNHKSKKDKHAKPK